MSALALLDSLDIEDSLRRIATGTFSRTIAEEHGVTSFAVRKRLAEHPSYPQAVKAQAESLVEQATDETMKLGDDCSMVAIARARVRVETAHKWAAARDPASWGAKQQVTVLTGPTLDSALDSLAAALLDKMRVVATQEQPEVGILPSASEETGEKTPNK